MTQSKAVAAAGLELLGVAGVYTLNTSNNTVTTLAGNTGTVKFQDNTGFAIGTVNTVGLTTTGNTTLSSTGVVTQSQTVGAAGLELLGATGVYTLTNASNAVTTLAGATGSATYSQTGALTIGTVNSTAGLATTGTPWITTGGALTIASGATVSGAASRSRRQPRLHQYCGSGARSQRIPAALAGLFRQFHRRHVRQSEQQQCGGLEHAVQWRRDGDRQSLCLRIQPLLTVTSVNATKVYGVDDATAAVAASFTISGLQSVGTNAYRGHAGDMSTAARLP